MSYAHPNTICSEDRLGYAGGDFQTLLQRKADFKLANKDLIFDLESRLSLKAATNLIPEVFRVLPREFVLQMLSLAVTDMLMTVKTMTEKECEIYKNCLITLRFVSSENHVNTFGMELPTVAPGGVMRDFIPSVTVDFTPGKEQKTSVSFTFTDLIGVFPFIVAQEQHLVVPLPLLLMDKKFEATKQHCVYMHTIETDTSDEDRESRGLGLTDSALTYAGITKQGPIKRFKAHLSAARTGRNAYIFHQALRDTFGEDAKKVLVTSIVGFGLSFEEAMNLEEEIVDEMTLYPRGLNMIPGGFAGLKYLSSRGVKANGRMLAETRDNMIAKLPRANPLLSAQWNDPDYAARVMCGWGNRLDAALVREINFYKELGFSWEKVSERIGRDDKQVKRVFNGKTYQRITS